MDKKKIEQAVRIILKAIGEDINRDGLRDTPRRVAEMYEEIFAGVGQDPKKELKT
ncbi:MAG: GTP cyclohydrolase I, partial [candidate division WOR-3 bacterium]